MEQVVGQPPVNKKKDITVGTQADALATIPEPVPTPTPTPTPSPSPTPDPAMAAFLETLTGRGLYDPGSGAFQGLGAVAALNQEMNRVGGLTKAPQWLLDMIAAQKGGTPFSTAKRSKEVFGASGGRRQENREVIKP